jgi:hypothetical protein
MIDLAHTRSCPELTPGSEDRCTCGLEFRKALATEQTMHLAWRKRAEDAERLIEAAVSANREWRKDIRGKSMLYRVIKGLAPICEALDAISDASSHGCYCTTVCMAPAETPCLRNAPLEGS